MTLTNFDLTKLYLLIVFYKINVSWLFLAKVMSQLGLVVEGLGFRLT